MYTREEHGSSVQPAEHRVSVVVGPRSVPLFPYPPLVDSAHSPWLGLVVEKHHVGPIAIPTHEHDTFCLHLQTSGPVTMDWQSAGRSGRITTGSGNLILLAPGTRDSLVWHGVSERIVASVDPSLLARAAEELGVKNPYDFQNRWSFQDEQLRLLLSEMEREVSSGWAMGSLYGDLLGMSLSVALIRKYGEASSQPPPLKGGLSRSNLRQVKAYVEENLDQNIRLQELARLTGLSVYHFARSFRESAGATPHQYLVQRRIERAKELLQRSEWTIQQIASATGFTDASQFAKTFRQWTGASPSTWRRNV
jgi:AraC family transcriptional regulator